MTPDEAQTAIVQYFNKERTTKKLNYGDKLDRHRGFFVGRRARSIGSLPANVVLLADPGLTALKARIENEYAQLDAFLEDKVKAMSPGGTDKTPKHLDLADMAKPKVNTTANIAKGNEQRYRSSRAYRVCAIGWRAAAIHDELWKASPDGKTATLQADAFHQVIDRRLHMVERMNFQISRADALGGSWSFTGGGPIGPWNDGFRIRIFEYPRIPREAVKQVAKFVGEANIAAPTSPPFQSTDPPWRWEPGKHRLIYNVGPEPGIQLAPSVRSDWVVEARLPYFRDLKPDPDNAPGNNASVVFDRMFTHPQPNWWDRNWLFCDHVISSLHLQALLFGLRRRNSAHGEAEFNGLVNAFPNIPGFVSIGSFVAIETTPKLGRLMAMEVDPDSNLNLPADPYFYNEPISEDDLQIGDHLVFYNSHIFSLISASEWSLENSVVIDVDSDQTKRGGTHRSQMRLQGHGTSEKKYSEYLLEVVRPLDEALGNVRDAITTAVAGDSTKTTLNWLKFKNLLVRWDPYERFPSPGAWWIRILVDPGEIPEGLSRYPGTIAQDPSPGSGYNSPPDANAVYFPLYRPKVPKFWEGYLDARRANRSVRLPKLEAFKADASITPGIFYGGKKAPIPVLRPKVIL
jgi:hypothetical protein